MSNELLVELGTEEIPAAFCRRALAALEDLAVERLAAARLAHGAVTVLGTPRRLVLAVANLADRQPDLREDVVGPPTRAAYDADGNPTKAALGFAAKNGVDVADLRREEVPGKKGEYVVCTRSEQGAPTRDVLRTLLADLLRDIPWQKQMRWHWGEDAFARPVHWLVALYGGEVLPVTFLGATAGRVTRGHRFLAPGPIVLEGDVVAYQRALRKAFVIVAPDERRQAIEGELARIESETGAKVRPDPALVDEVAFLVEYPVGICGDFDEGYLDVPEEVVVSAMRSHQRYFAMSGPDGSLMNRFATIAGTVTKDTSVVKRGNERVLAARLADARFFFREDQQRSLDDWATRLDGVVFQSKLGSIGAKVARVRGLAETLGAEHGASHVGRAAALCKADLVTHMVGEFPELQGIMGARYAALANEPGPVCAAIEEHYQPKGSQDALPASVDGAVLAVADRIDTIVGCFAAGLAPTGSADPYALRRASLGVLSILLERGWHTRLGDLVDRAAEAYAGTIEVTARTRAEVLAFLRVRLRGMLVDGRSLPADCVDAALAVGCEDVPDAAMRADAVAALRERADFEPLAVAFKRVANILKGASSSGAPDASAFREDAERELWRAFDAARARVDQHLADNEYGRALDALAQLGPTVDAFFDVVLVMDEDAAVRANRLALLSTINTTFTRIADFRQLAV